MSVHFPIVIIGGGVAGLWVLNALHAAGYKPVLLEKNALGGGQTIASQGMIHGGQRYTLHGKAETHAHSIAAMPGRWDAHLSGTAAPDLSSVPLLANEQYMFSPGTLGSSVAAFFASKNMQTRMSKLSRSSYPPALQHLKKTAQVFSLPEKVMQSHELVEALRAPLQDVVLQAEVTHICAGAPCRLSLCSGNETLDITADVVLSCAAGFNRNACAAAGFAPESHTQQRPLKQILVRTLPQPLFAHAVTTDPRPRVTISAHPHNGGYVWYLGGLVGVYGTDKSDDDALAFAQKEMQTLFTHINWQEKEWATLYINRDEPAAPSGYLPEGPVLKTNSNIGIGWPTKMTFAPALADEVLAWVNTLAVSKSSPAQLPALPHPPVAPYPWETANWRTL